MGPLHRGGTVTRVTVTGENTTGHPNGEEAAARAREKTSQRRQKNGCVGTNTNNSNSNSNSYRCS